MGSGMLKGAAFVLVVVRSGLEIIFACGKDVYPPRL